MGLEVRTATVEDAVVLHRLILGLAEEQGQSAFLSATPAGLAEALAADRPRAFFLLAEEEGRAVGYVSWTRVYGIWRGGDYLNLDDLFVIEGARGAGVGEALMRAFAARALEAELPARWEVNANNHGAQRFYARLGAEMAGKVITRWSLSAMRAV
jgi:GNAT superfamily N-acetyltransferase